MAGIDLITVMRLGGWKSLRMVGEDQVSARMWTETEQATTVCHAACSSGAKHLDSQSTKTRTRGEGRQLVG